MWIMLGGERVADRRRVRRPLLSLPSPLSTQRNPCCHAAAAVADGGAAGAPTLEGDVTNMHTKLTLLQSLLDIIIKRLKLHIL